MLLEGNEKAKTRLILKKRVSVVGRRLLGIVGSHVEGTDGRAGEMVWESVYYKGHVVRVVRNG